MSTPKPTASRCGTATGPVGHVSTPNGEQSAAGTVPRPKRTPASRGARATKFPPPLRRMVTLSRCGVTATTYVLQEDLHHDPVPVRWPAGHPVRAASAPVPAGTAVRTAAPVRAAAARVPDPARLPAAAVRSAGSAGALRPAVRPAVLPAAPGPAGARPAGPRGLAGRVLRPAQDRPPAGHQLEGQAGRHHHRRCGAGGRHGQGRGCRRRSADQATQDLSRRQPAVLAGADAPGPAVPRTPRRPRVVVVPRGPLGEAGRRHENRGSLRRTQGR